MPPPCASKRTLERLKNGLCYRTRALSCASHCCRATELPSPPHTQKKQKKHRWNFTPSPGWTKEEVQILRLCLMKLGVGQWVAILNTGLLPGKMIQQLNGQTQRLLGQQSLAAYTGLRVDVDRIRSDNEAQQGPAVQRKSGLIIWSGRALFCFFVVCRVCCAALLRSIQKNQPAPNTHKKQQLKQPTRPRR